MSATTGRRGLQRVLAAVLLASAVLLPAAARPAVAADVTFGAPDATASYGEGITFTVPMTAAAPLKRLEIRLVYPGSLGPFVAEVPVATGGSQTFRLDLAGDGHLLPNTTIEASWAAFPKDGGEPVLSAVGTVRYADTDHEWRTMKGDLVVVHWYEGDEAFARRALAIGDKAVKDTADVLDVTETKPIDFFIYGDQDSFRNALGPGTREWSVGTSIAETRTLFALITPDQIDSWEVERTISHELVHLVFDTAARNPYRAAPHWFNEGLATYLSEGYATSYRQPVEEAAASGELLPLRAYTGSFPTGSDPAWLAYSESVSAIDYIMRTDGRDGLLALVAGFKEGLTDDEAFTKALGRDMATFERGWLDDLGGTVLEQLGPVPNPTGPLPPGWDAPANGGSPSATPGTGTNPGAATARPAGTPGPAAPGDGTGSSGGSGDTLLVFGAIFLVVVVVLVGMVIARRRTAGP